ncbi:hypothetical protein DFP73DRAFT_52412 [Morchella snyderi]|nr:hypothetical protein DFP73DRAFT_52412 [Morchella snyderi]
MGHIGLRVFVFIIVFFLSIYPHSPIERPFMPADDVFYVLTLLHCIVYLFILKPERHLYCSSTLYTYTCVLATAPKHDLCGGANGSSAPKGTMYVGTNIIR